jgi:hypothetical protein
MVAEALSSSLTLNLVVKLNKDSSPGVDVTFTPPKTKRFRLQRPVI